MSGIPPSGANSRTGAVLDEQQHCSNYPPRQKAGLRGPPSVVEGEGFEVVESRGARTPLGDLLAAPAGRVQPAGGPIELAVVLPTQLREGSGPPLEALHSCLRSLRESSTEGIARLQVVVADDRSPARRALRSAFDDYAAPGWTLLDPVPAHVLPWHRSGKVLAQVRALQAVRPTCQAVLLIDDDAAVGRHAIRDMAQSLMGTFRLPPWHHGDGRGHLLDHRHVRPVGMVGGFLHSANGLRFRGPDGTRDLLRHATMTEQVNDQVRAQSRVGAVMLCPGALSMVRYELLAGLAPAYVRNGEAGAEDYWLTMAVLRLGYATAATERGRFRTPLAVDPSSWSNQQARWASAPFRHADLTRAALRSALPPAYATVLLSWFEQHLDMLGASEVGTAAQSLAQEIEEGRPPLWQRNGGGSSTAGAPTGGEPDGGTRDHRSGARSGRRMHEQRPERRPQGRDGGRGIL